MSILRVNRLGSGQGVVFDKILMQFHSCLAICCAACYFGFGGFCTVKVTFIRGEIVSEEAYILLMHLRFQEILMKNSCCNRKKVGVIFRENTGA